MSTIARAQSERRPLLFKQKEEKVFPKQARDKNEIQKEMDTLEDKFIEDSKNQMLTPAKHLAYLKNILYLQKELQAYYETEFIRHGPPNKNLANQQQPLIDQTLKNIQEMESAKGGRRKTHKRKSNKKRKLTRRR